MDTKTFGDRLAQARLMRGWSQTDLGKAADMAPTQVSRYEAGRATPRGLTLGRLASSLGVKAEWLVSGVGDVEGGRAPYPKPDEPTHEFVVPLSAEEKRDLEAAAKAEGVTAEQFFRMKVRQYLDMTTIAELREGKLPNLERLEQEVAEQHRRLEEMAATLRAMSPEAAKSSDVGGGAHKPTRPKPKA